MAEPISKAVLITGCSTGIGRATAQWLSNRGWKVYATARNLASIADLESHRCKTLALDVCDSASMRAAVAAVESAEGAVGVLINNAGYGLEGTFEEVPMDQVRRQFETNVFGLIEMTKLVLPGMRRQRWGRIVNLSSMGGKLTFPGGAYYHASKHAVEAMSDALRFEVKGFGINVVVIEPGPIKTSFGDTAVNGLASLADSPYAAVNTVLAKQVREAYEGGPMARFAAAPEAVAEVIGKAITAENPKSRYTVTMVARILMGLRRILPDRAFDAILRTQFPTPSA
jgi:NAD(P)-dependent dehydrogenase (short-subunit alcohol dehydrogenase family)